ncbi:MAG: PDZ domain-containing protein [Alphaproteobacteria bacterium]|nr:PDZ domain-containing protein [Alphaproteobacteria bacterium]
MSAGPSNYLMRTVRWTLSAISILIVNGCANDIEKQKRLESGHILTVALENLADRYIEPIQPRGMSINGLRKLIAIDPSLSIEETETEITFNAKGSPLTRYKSPEDTDVHEWADLTVKLVNQAREQSSTLAQLSEEETHKLLLSGIIEDTDKYSRYLPPNAAGRSRATRDGFGGIGVVLDQMNDRVIIRDVTPNNPAAKAGLRAKDEITHIDGKSILGLSLKRVAKLLRGEVSKPVEIGVSRKGSENNLSFTVIRDHVIRQSVVSRHTENFLILRIKSFNQGTVSTLRKSIVRAVKEMGSGLKGIVLDLRNNPGGLLDQAIAVADLFMVNGRIISTKGRHAESNQIFNATPGEVLAGMPVAVLINGRSASAAEIVAAALRDSGRAALIGSTSYGKGTVQTIVRLPNTAEYHLTWARILAPSGQTLDSQGIVPVICTNISRVRLNELKTALDESSENLTAIQNIYRPQATLPHYSRERKLACPPSSVRPIDDLKTAKLLLMNKKIYQATIAHPPTNLAER